MTSLMQMGLLRWDDRPQLRRPVLVAAFEGWNDAGNAASEAVATCSGLWAASPSEPLTQRSCSTSRPADRMYVSSPGRLAASTGPC